MGLDSSCLFCRIIAGEIPAKKIYENEFAFAFLDIHPHAKGHTVVIPKTHAVTLLDLDSSYFEGVMLAVKESQRKLDAVFTPQGYNIGWNHGKLGGQAVPHLHVHILPRYVGDGGSNMHGIVKAPGNLSVDEVFELLK